MKRFFRFLATAALAAALLAGVAAVWLENTRVEAGDLPPLRTGDVVFQESGNMQSTAISLASKSLYTHTGLIEVGKDGRAYVVEASGPVRTTPLDAWIKHGTAGRITVKRVKGLDDSTARRVLKAAHAYDGRPYDFYFYEDRDTVYCSELVHLAFKEGAGFEVGAPQKVKDLNIDNAAVRSLIEERWRDHPLCRNGKAAAFEACYAKILQQTLVTPAAVARDLKLDMVFTNFGPAAE